MNYTSHIKTLVGLFANIARTKPVLAIQAEHKKMLKANDGQEPRGFRVALAKALVADGVYATESAAKCMVSTYLPKKQGKPRTPPGKPTAWQKLDRAVEALLKEKEKPEDIATYLFKEHGITITQ